MALSQNQIELLDRYLEAIIEKNKIINLTRIDSFGTGKVLHLEDSLAGAEIVAAAPEGRGVDLGSGGGFPGVPLSIATGREFTLVDSVKKKMAAVQDVLDGLNVNDQIMTYAGRAEELATECPCAFSVVTARAVSQLPSLLELSSPLLIMGGILLAFKSAHCSEELESALSIQDLVGMELFDTKEIELSNSDPRVLYVFKKVEEARIKLPRRIGQAQSHPLRPR